MEILSEKGRKISIDGNTYYLKCSLNTLNKLNELADGDIGNFAINSSNLSIILSWMINEYIDEYNISHEDKLKYVTVEFLNLKITNKYAQDVIKFILACMKGDYEEKNF
ncbi:hypothetical protein [Anaerorhabdus sp.]|uniref:hypothetical protein n=1 Tax=Anaerorhabdus sp. TaxID=1872524 RepID=UPI002B20AF8D|nr:hypothetical protein [Anaerorhabdus sp.]MEA4876027.1 hypothetical protein [Anaerorhabdus sp.]